MTTFLKLFIFYFVVIVANGHEKTTRFKRQGELSTRWISRRGGIDVPVTLTSVITCLSAGINEAICLGPRVSLFAPRKLVATEKKGFFYRYRNGVDLRGLENAGIPGISEDNTEIGHRIGATVADRGTEFGVGQHIFNYYKDNLGGVVEADKNGVGVDIGYRAAAADDKVQIKASLFGISVGEPQGDIANPPFMPGSRYRAPTSYYFQNAITGNRAPLARYQPQTRDQWWRSQFMNYGQLFITLSEDSLLGDEYKSKKDRQCPWCFAARPFNK